MPLLVSIPHRIEKNASERDPDRLLTTFPSLIGLRKTAFRGEAFVRLSPVSIPHRIEKNATSRNTFPEKTDVSIPHRIEKNEQIEAKVKETGDVSIPHRIEKNSPSSLDLLRE